MIKSQQFPYVLGVAALAMMFSAMTVHPQAAPQPGESGAGMNAMMIAQAAGGAQSGPSADTSSAPAGKAAASKAAASAGSLSKGDRDLMRDIAHANLSEIETGKLAQSKSKNENVRKFAQQMIDDHTKAQGEVQQLAQAKGVTLPTEPDTKHKALMKKMEGMSEAEFDKQYMAKGGVADHKDTHRLLKKTESRAKDADLKALAGKMLPTVDQHLTMAKDMTGSKSASGGMGGDSKAGSGTSK